MDCLHAFDSEDDETAAPASAGAEHRVTCLRCSRTHRALDRVRPVLRDLPSAPASPDFLHRLEDRLAAIDRARERRGRTLRLALGLGSSSALAAVLALLLVYDRPLPSARPDERTSAGAAIRVVRPVDRLELTEAGGPFAAAPGHTVEGADPDLASALPWSASLASALPALSDGSRPGGARIPAAAWAAPVPVLFAAPSWSFAATPAALSFASAPAGFPPATR